MAHGGRRTGAGRPKGRKDPHTLEKEAAREHVRKRITTELDTLIDAALKRAKGLSYLVTRDAKTGKFVRVTRATLASADAATEVWEKEPDIAAIRDLLDRAIDKPKEQQIDVTVEGNSDTFIALINRVRQRAAEEKRRNGKG